MRPLNCSKILLFEFRRLALQKKLSQSIHKTGFAKIKLLTFIALGRIEVNQYLLAVIGRLQVEWTLVDGARLVIGPVGVARCTHQYTF